MTRETMVQVLRGDRGLGYVVTGLFGTQWGVVNGFGVYTSAMFILYRASVTFVCWEYFKGFRSLILPVMEVGNVLCLYNPGVYCIVLRGTNYVEQCAAWGVTIVFGGDLCLETFL